MARKSTQSPSFDEIVRDAFAAGFLALGGNPVGHETRHRKLESAASGTRQDPEYLGDLATTLS